MKSCLRREFSTQNIWFSYPKAEAFYLPQWKWSRIVFAMYRVSLAFYTMACLLDYVIVMSHGSSPVSHNIMAYMTTWTYSLLVLHFNMAAVITLFCMWKEKRGTNRVIDTVKPTSIRRLTLPSGLYDQKSINPDIYFHGKSELEAGFQVDIKANFSVEADRSTWYMKLSWLVFSVVFNWAIIVTLIFFGAIYPGFIQNEPCPVISFEDINIHALNTVFVILEVILCAYPVRLYHVLYSIFYGMIYLVFNICYWSSDRENNIIYPGILDWNYPWTSLVMALLLAFVITPFLQLVHFVLYHIRCFLFRKIYGHEYIYRRRPSALKKTISTDTNGNTKDFGVLPRDDSTAPMISTIIPMATEHLTPIKIALPIQTLYIPEISRI
ncbi:protein rolling stone [Octopus bimaculoides]|nr:protein rolling stone [Octopus bimaculoides]|eukprot:XP_014776571.1 PREDICTED: protein rolling stone-like [Octopus bimaculoides]